MKYLLMIFSLPFIACISGGPKLSLPEKWTKDLTITVYNGGGMAYESLEIVYTADSCKYDHMEEGKHSISTFKLTDKDKETILKELNKLGLGKVYSKPTKGIIHDKASTRICVTLNPKTENCAESGATETIASNADGFYAAYSYLVDFASKKQH